MYAKAEKHEEYDYSLAIKNKGRPPKPWRWEIYLAGKSKPVRQSEFLETMSEATRTGKVALAEVRAKRAALTLARDGSPEAGPQMNEFCWPCHHNFTD